MFARLSAVVLLATGAQSVAAQMETVVLGRDSDSEPSLRAVIEFGGGEMFVGAAEPGRLYSATTTFRDDLLDLVDSYDPRARVFELRLHDWSTVLDTDLSESDHPKGTDWLGQTLDLFFDAMVPLDLDVSFGGGELDLELGGMAISNLRLTTGAAETSLAFARPNRVPCGYLQIVTGAAEFAATGLGNAGCRSISVAGGVAGISLDFSGEWSRREIDLEADFGLAPLTLTIPQDVGVVLEMDRFLVGFEADGFRRRGSRYESDNLPSAERVLRVEVTGALGTVRIIRN